MKIMAISDEESKYLWDYYQKEKLDGVELILSSGDLDPDYLSWQLFHLYLCYMLWEIMMINIFLTPQRAVSA